MRWLVVLSWDFVILRSSGFCCCCCVRDFRRPSPDSWWLRVNDKAVWWSNCWIFNWTTDGDLHYHLQWQELPTNVLEGRSVERSRPRVPISPFLKVSNKHWQKTKQPAWKLGINRLQQHYYSILCLLAEIMVCDCYALQQLCLWRDREKEM